MAHAPVLLKEVIEGLSIKKGDTVLDCTVNLAGHGKEMASLLGRGGVFIGLDLNEKVLAEAREVLSEVRGPKVILKKENFRNIGNLPVAGNGIRPSKVLFDLGFSSNELERSGRGFSFLRDEPLLMAFDSTPPKEALTAEVIVNDWGEETLADVIFGFGGERNAKKIAHAIVLTRAVKPIKTSGELARIIERASPRRSRLHPATKTFQALRIAVNDELGALKEGLASAAEILAPGGRIAVISFHELEDRIVKRFFRELVQGGGYVLLNKKPITPSREEIESNPRSRSAKLRIIQKI